MFANLDDVGCVIKNENGLESFCQVKCKIVFEDTIIYRANFENTTFFNDVIFSNTKFIWYAKFANSVFNGEATFKSLKFKDELNEQDKYILNLCQNKSLSVFSDETIEVSINNTIDFTNTVFNSNVCFDSLNTEPTHNEEKYTEYKFDLLSNINLNGSQFKKKLKIFRVTIGDISMQNCHFDDTVNISLNKYNKSSRLDFSLSTINCLFFMDSYFGEEKGIPFNLSDEISFKKSLITKDAFVFFRNINPIKKAGTLDFSYANILGTVTIQDSKLKLIKLDKSTIIGDINIEKVETDYDSRESIAKVKNSYLKRNDVVNSLDYKAKEMKFYSDSLSKCFSCKLLKINKLKFIDLIKKYFMTLKQSHFIVKKLWSFIKFVLFKCILLPLVILPLGILLSIIPFRSLEKVREYTLLYLNRISNSFGMSWGQGVLFTCVTAWIFFVLINYMGVESSHLFVLWQYGWGGFGDVWQNYLRMFYLTKFEDVFNTGIKLNVYGETLFFVSKIFVSYGIYQTISAFRKYGK